MILFASPHACVRTQDDGQLEVETPDAVLTYCPEDAPFMIAAFDAATEPTPAAELYRSRADDRRGDALLAPAIEAGALRDVSAFVSAPTSAAQLKAYYDLCDSWAKDIFLAPFWTTVLGGDASTQLMLGWCEQFYHRTVGADEHNKVAVDHCNLPGVADALMRHFSEEVGHGEIFLQGLAAAGVSRESVASQPPLPSTRGLVDFFSDLGRRDTLAYLACYGVLHSPREGQTLEAVCAQFAALAEAYPEAAPAIRQVGKHAEIDVGVGHDQIVFEPYLLARPPLRGAETHRVLSSVRGTVTVFNRFFEGILAAYGGPPD